MTPTPASPALTEADQAMRDSLIAFFQDRYWQVPRLITDEVDALLAGPLATLRAERDAAVTRANEEEVGAALDRAFRKVAEARATAAEATLREREAEIERLRAGLKGILPGKLCGESWGLPDTERMPIQTTLGALKAARAALAQPATPASHDEATR